MRTNAVIMIYRVIAVVLFISCCPLFLVFFILVKFTSKGPFLFKQKRAGKDKKPFTIYKIRTMIQGAENIQRKYKDLNQANGPVFKIYNDPRYTKIGKFLAHTGLDELPQLINVIKGEMSFVGPRPLPIDEARRVPKKYERRFSILPGITSIWVVKGSHKLTFKKWMMLDLDYVNKQSLFYDINIMIKTMILIICSILRML